MTQGLLIVVEGISGVGKTTLCNTLATRPWVSKYTFPSKEKFGMLVRDEIKPNTPSTLNPDALTLAFALHRYDLKEKIIADMNRGQVVVCDRYTASGYVYGGLRGSNLKWCEAIDEQMPKPDLWIFIEWKPQECFKASTHKYLTEEGMLSYEYAHQKFQEFFYNKVNVMKFDREINNPHQFENCVMHGIYR